MNQRRLFEILERSLHKDRTSKQIDHALMVLILLNVVAVVLESVDHFSEHYALPFWYFELFSVGVFGIEYLLRLWSCAADRAPGETALKRRLRYAFSFYGIIDFLAVIPIFLQIFITVDLRVIRVVRIIRVLKFTHYSDALHDLAQAVKSERSAYLATLYLLMLVILLSSCAIYLAEHDVQPKVFGSIPQAMWWSIVTLTTVGYGDVVPITIAGKVIAVVTSFMGLSSVAMMTGILSGSFVVQHQRRKQLFRAHMQKVLDDGIITLSEQKLMDTLKQRWNISDEEAQQLHDELMTVDDRQ